MGITPLTLAGVSQYSSDFQSILNRAVQIAQVPITALQNKDSELLQQKSLLSTLNANVADLVASLQSLGTTAQNQAVAATSSDPTVATANATGAATPGSFTINSVTSLATAASEHSTSGYADSLSTPISSTGTLKLVVGSNQYTFTLTNNSLIGLRDQINSLGAGVTASILTTANGNYLSLSANSTGHMTLRLIDDPTGAQTNLLTAANQGSDAEFHLNGIDITQKSNFINSVVPGVTFQLLKESSSPVTISLASDRTQLSSALQDFVTNYNSLHSGLAAQVGQNAGQLSGDLMVTQLQGQLRSLTSYRTSAGSVKSLSDLGITFDSTGKSTFNQNTFDSLSDTQLSDAFSFVGSETNGLASFGNSLNEFSDPVSGLIKLEQNGIDRTDQSIQNQITTLTDRITSMQTQLSQQLTAADALQAELQSQQQTIGSSVQSLNLVLYGCYPNL